MNPRRLIAATAAVLTALVVQASVITPLTGVLFVSVPAVLVAAVGIEAGPSAGMSVGFSAGLLADLGSRHPAGVLALAWLLLGLGCGRLVSHPRRVIASIAIGALGSALIGLLTAIALIVVHAPSGSLASVLSLALPSLLGNLVLAAVVVPPVRVIARALGAQVSSAPAPRSRVVIDG